MIRCLFRSSEAETFRNLPPDQLADALACRDGTVWLDVAHEAGDSEEIVRLGGRTTSGILGITVTATARKAFAIAAAAR